MESEVFYEQIQKPSMVDSLGASNKDASSSVVYTKPHPMRWLVLASFCLVAQGNGMVFLSFSSISGKAQTFYGISEARVNFLVILFYSVYIPFSPIATYLVNGPDGVRRNVLVAAISMATGGIIRVFGYDSSPSSFNLIIIGTTICAINGPFLMSCFTLIPANWFPASERGFATSLGVLANQMGMVSGYLMPPLIVSETEQGSTLKSQILTMNIVLASIMVVAAILALFLIKSRPNEANEMHIVGCGRDHNMSTLTALGICVRNLDFWVYGLSFALLCPIYWDLGTLLYQTMSPSGYTDTQILIPGVVLQAIAIPAMIGAGKLIDKTHRYEAIIIFSIILALVSMAVFTWTLTLDDSYWNLCIITLASAATGFAFSTMQPALLDIVAERTHPVPHGYTCSMLYLGTMVVGPIYIVIGDSVSAIELGVIFTILIAVILSVALVVPRCRFTMFGEELLEEKERTT